MIRDITGTVLTPGNMGKDCLGDGRHYNKKGELIECCCDECPYLMCCVYEDFEKSCTECFDYRCPRCKNKVASFFKYLRLLFKYFFRLS